MRRVRLPLLPGFVRWGLVVVIAAGIAVASVVRPTGVRAALGPLGLVGVSAWLHAVGYLLLAMALGYALLDSPLDRVLATVFAAAVGYGLLLELVQSQLAYRTASLFDVVANGLGATLAAAVWWLVLMSARIRVQTSANPDGAQRRP